MLITLSKGTVISNLVITERILIDRTDIQLVLAWTKVKAKGLVKVRTLALDVLGPLLKRLFEPHFDIRVRLAEPVLVPGVGRTVQFDVELAPLGDKDADGSFGVDLGFGVSCLDCGGDQDGNGSQEGGDKSCKLHG